MRGNDRQPERRESTRRGAAHAVPVCGFGEAIGSFAAEDAGVPAAIGGPRSAIRVASHCLGKVRRGSGTAAPETSRSWAAAISRQPHRGDRGSANGGIGRPGRRVEIGVRRRPRSFRRRAARCARAAVGSAIATRGTPTRRFIRPRTNESDVPLAARAPSRPLAIGKPRLAKLSGAAPPTACWWSLCS